MQKIKTFLNHLIVRNLIIFGGIFLSFFVLDLSLRYFSNQYVGFFGFLKSAPNLFTFSWIFLIIGVLYLLPKKAKMITYSILIVISNILVYAEYLHFQVLKRFFTFSDLLLTKEGSDYFLFAIGRTNYKIMLVLLASIFITGFTLFIIYKTEEIHKNKYYYIGIILSTVVVVSGTRMLANYKLGPTTDSTTYRASYYAKNIYLDYNNQNKSLEVSGIYELTIRSFYLYIRDMYFSNRDKMIEEIDTYLEDKETIAENNSYTGMLEGKNVIYVLMETIDEWLITEDVMPTLYQLREEGLNFTNRYSPAFGGGQTINSEFSMNTGLYAMENGKAIYNYDSNTFSYSLANMLKDNGYSAISMHTNSGAFYNRSSFHSSLGYDTHYALDDIYTINHRDYNYYNDSSLVKNDETYDLLVREEPFFSFIIGYSAHIPYDDTNDRCVENPYGLNVEGDTELSCIRNLAKETDEMLRILIERLEEDGLLDNTALVLVTDHYAYGYEDQDSIMEYKDTNNSYLLQHVPFIIWSNDIEAEEIDTIMDTADILPTVLNLLGISYNPNYYVGQDVFRSDRDNFVYFKSDIFYDGELFYDGTVDEDTDTEYVDQVLAKINQAIKFNNNIILSDYFRSK